MKRSFQVVWFCMIPGWLLLPAALSGQGAAVHGRLLEVTNARSISGAAIYLISASGDAAGADLSNEQGRFRLDVPVPGPYRLRVERIGYETELTDEFDVPPGGLAGLEIKLRVRPIELDPLEVRAQRVCQIAAESANRLLSVWYEARKALAATLLSAGRSGMTYVVELYEREMDRNLHIRSDRTDTLSVGSGRAFQFIREEELEDVGWGRVEKGVITRFYGPSPEAVLSPWFESSHCFTLVKNHEEHADELGLAFATIDDVVPVGMEGVFWIDPVGWHLRSIDFRYEAASMPRNAKHQGGTITLDINPNGSWYVKSWLIRRPILGADQRRRTSFIPGLIPDRRQVVVGYLERGGRVLVASPPRDP